MDRTPNDVDPAAPAARGRRPRPSARALLLMLAALALTIATLSLAGWSLHSDAGSAWWLNRVPGLQVEGVTGRLLGDLDVQRAVLRWPGGTATATRLGWRGLSVHAAPARLGLRIDVVRLSIGRLDVASATTDHAAPLEPSSLAMPVELDLQTLQLGELHVGASGDPLLHDLQAHVHLAAAGSPHRIDGLTFTSDTWQARGDAQIALQPPFLLAAQLAVAPTAVGRAPDWRAQIDAAGPLAAPVLGAAVRTVPSAAHPPQALDLHAELRPFAAWPLGDVRATTDALDLSVFGHGAPVTALSGQATAHTTAADAPASVSIQLTNRLAGRWSEAGLPVRSVALEIAGRPNAPRALDVKTFDAELGTADARAGHVTGEGRWSPDGWTFSARLQAVRPDLLDARAPALELGGPVRLTGGASTATGIEVQADLAGAQRSAAIPGAARLRVDATVGADHLDLRSLQASVGGARASGSGRLNLPPGDAPIALQAQLSLLDFDPTVWWPGPADSAWRRAAPRLNGQIKTDVTLPRNAWQRDGLDRLAQLRGQGSVTLDPSTVAGVSLAGQATLRSAAPAQALVALRLASGGNELTADGHLDIAGRGDGDAWNLALKAPALQALAPLWQLSSHPAAAPPTLAGRASAAVQVRGRWPQMTTQGQAQASELRVLGWEAAHADASWTLGTSASAPVDAQVQLGGLHPPPSTGPAPVVEAVTLKVGGTGQAHSMALRAQLAIPAPAAATAASRPSGPGSAPANAPQPADGATVRIDAHGGLRATKSDGAAGWGGTVDAIDVQRAGSAVLSAQTIALRLDWEGVPPRVQWQAGHADVLGAALHWSGGSWTAPGPGATAAAIAGEFDWDPVAVAPWLARLQPDFGWGGDLTLGGRLTFAGGSGTTTVLAVRRDRGDLTVTDEVGTRALGLDTVELGLEVAQGVWTLSQRIEGKALGVLAGDEVIRAPPGALWPPADARVEGTIAANVTDLGTWGNWVPPGWRLGGTLQAQARLGGRVASPEFTGAIVGRSLSVRNFLEGVAISDGEVLIRLDGTSALIERFVARAGRGTVNIAGRAELGAHPSAELNLTADKFQVLGRVDRRVVASGTTTLMLAPSRLALDGALRIDDGLIDFSRSDAPGLSDDVQVLRPAPAASGGRSPGAAQPTAGTANRDVAVKLTLDLGEQLRLRGRGLDAGLRGELKITSPGGRLAVNGTVRTVDGTYAAYNQKLSIDRGTVVFSGSADNPRLDIEATRPNIDTRVGVQISGTATNPRVRLFSEPEMADIDKLSWLVLGRASDGLGSTDTALLQHAALALLAGEGGGLTGQLTRAIGLDDLSVRQQTDGTVQETVVSLGKQLSQRWYVGYEHGLNATTGSFQVIYRIAQRFTLRAQSGTDNSLDLLWSWRWR